MDSSTIGIVVFLGSFFAARLVNERALKGLKQEEAARLLRGFSRYRIFSLVGVIVIVAAYFIAYYNFPDSAVASPPVIMGVLVAFLLLNSVIAFRKLKQLEMPDDYINKFLLGTFIQYAGIFVLFGTSLGAR